MKTSLRLGIAVTILIALFWMKIHLEFIQTQWQHFRDDSLPFIGRMKEPEGPGQSDSAGGGHAANLEDGSPAEIQESTTSPTTSSSQTVVTVSTSNGDGSVTPGDRIVVVGKLAGEDTNWITTDLPDWQRAIYTVDDPKAPLHPAKNKGRESNVYLQYIIDNYDRLPSTIVFLHSHRDGYPQAWHTEFEDHSNVDTVRMLQTDFVQRNGYANMRCTLEPGCPDEIVPFRNPRDEWRTAEHAVAETWRYLFNNSDIPEVIATPCCSQFAVSSSQVHMRPLSDYQWFHKWLLETELSDDLSGRIMEYLWHIIFGQEPVYCPDLFQCYRDVYGMGLTP